LHSAPFRSSASSALICCTPTLSLHRFNATADSEQVPLCNGGVPAHASACAGSKLVYRFCSSPFLEAAQGFALFTSVVFSSAPLVSIVLRLSSQAAELLKSDLKSLKLKLFLLRAEVPLRSAANGSREQFP
jgi:hypothetical protein